MYRRMCLLVVLGSGWTLMQGSLTRGADPRLVGWWRLDETSGTTAHDSSKNGYNGTVGGTPQWVAGKFGRALECDGTADYIDVPCRLAEETFSLDLWLKPSKLPVQADAGSTSTTSTTYAIVGSTDWVPGAMNVYLRPMTTAYGGCPAGSINVDTNAGPYDDNPWVGSSTMKGIPAGEWSHIALVCDRISPTSNKHWIYINGAWGTETTGDRNNGQTRMFLGPLNFMALQGQSNFGDGMIDDVRVYGYAQTVQDIVAVMKGAGIQPTATNPVPSDGDTDVDKNVLLSWTPDESAAAHDVYLGKALEDVSNASRTDPRGVLVSQGQDPNTFKPHLDYGQTYYWRVDEVNAPDKPGLCKGDTWSFTVEPYGYPVKHVKATASSSMAATMGPEKTIDGSGLDVLDQHCSSASAMWLSKKGVSPICIRYEFDTVYKLHQMWVWNSNQAVELAVGLGAKEVVVETSLDGAAWTALANVPQFAQASGELTYVHNTTVDFGGVQAKYVKLTIKTNWADNSKQAGLSEVRFFYVPVKAFGASPASGATGVGLGAVLSWRPGREAAKHQVYLGTDPNAVASGTAPVQTVTDRRLALSAFSPEYGRTYTWKVNEVNDAAATKTWEGDLWSFSTAAYAVVDDFEAYDDNCRRIFFTWVDGFGHSGSPTCGVAASSGNATGSTVGNVAAPFAERTIVHGGRQAMPFSYENTTDKSRSEVTRTFESAQDWTLGGAKTLAMYFYGDPANSAQELYVKVNDSKIVYTGNVADVSRRRWNPWNVDLTGIAAATLRGVKTLTIGVGGGMGKLLIDDIRLYRLAPEIAKVNPGTAGLVAYYAMSNNLQDSSGNGNNGALVGAPTYVAGQAGLGTALKLSGTADCVNLGKKPVFDFAGSFSISLWAHISNFSTSGWGHVMIGNRGEDNVGWQVRRYGSNATMAFTTRGVGTDDMASKASIPLNEWIHITCVYDNAGNTKRIYLNGVEDSVANTNAGAKVAATTHNTYIGARANNDNTGQEGFFNGMLDEIRVYNRVLSGAEVEFLSAP